MEFSPPRLSLFPGAREKALVFSFDDGCEADRRLVELFNRHGLRATFHLSSGLLGRAGHVCPEEVRDLYAGHEIAAHTAHHPNLMHVPEMFRGSEIYRDRERLEALTGVLVRGFSFPYGASDDVLQARLPKMGLAYARTIESSGHCYLPKDFYAWNPTCHAGDKLGARLDEFFAARPLGQWPLLLAAWGHAVDFDAEGWRRLDAALGRIAEARESVWCATAIEVADYLAAQAALRWGADGRLVQNASQLDIWVSVDGKPARIPAGETLRIGAGAAVRPARTGDGVLV